MLQENNKLNFKSVFEGIEYNVITIPPGAYEKNSFNEEIKRIIIKEG